MSTLKCFGFHEPSSGLLKFNGFLGGGGFLFFSLLNIIKKKRVRETYSYLGCKYYISLLLLAVIFPEKKVTKRLSE